MTDGHRVVAGTVGGVDRLSATLEQVRARTPIDHAEEESVSAFLRHVERLVAAGADPFDERDDPVHVTGSAIVVGERGTVLLEHRRLGMWLQPGGHIDPGEDPWDAARREAAEETGLDVVFHDGRVELVHVDVHAGGRGHTHLDLRYLLDGGSADPDPPAGESQAVAWFAWPAAVERAGDPRLAGLLGVLGRRFG